MFLAFGHGLNGPFLFDDHLNIPPAKIEHWRWSHIVEVIFGALSKDPNARFQSCKELATALESVIRAQEKRYLMANVPKSKIEEVREVIAAKLEGGME